MISRRLVVFSAPLLVTGIAGTPAAVAQTKSSRSSSAIVTRQALVAINRYRKSKRRDPLIIDPRAEKVALEHCQEMAFLGELTHDGFKKRLADADIPTPSAENIAVGQQNVNEVLKAWIRSSGHRRNLLGIYNRTGLAVARNANSGNRPYWTMILSV